MPNQTLHHDVHQSARYDDDFLGGLAFHEFHRAFGGECGGFEVGFGGVGGDGDFAAQFAVDLNHDFDFGFDQGGFVDCRPACFPQFRAV